MKHLILLVVLLLWGLASFSQTNEDRMVELEERLQAVEKQGFSLSDSITIVMNGSLKELVGFLGESTQLNLAVDPQIKQQVSVSFTEIPVRDIILYLCDAQQLDLKFIGNIIQFVPYVEPVIEPVQEPLQISFDTASQLLTMDLRRDTLDQVSRKISELSGVNVTVDPGVRYLPVDGYVNAASLEIALQQLALNNQLIIDSTDNFFTLKGALQAEGINSANPRQGNAPQATVQNLSIRRAGNNRINVQALNVPIIDVVREAALELKANYFILPGTGGIGSSTSGRGQGNRNLPPVIGASTISLQLQQATFAEVLDQVFKNSDLTYEESAGLFIIGDREAEDLRETKVIQLQYRSAQGVMERIPEELLTGLSIDTMMELNSLIMSGSRKNMEEVERFVQAIDKLVPVVMIEVIIIDVQTNRLTDMGIQAGTVPGGVPPGGEVSGPGGVDFTFSPKAINRLLGILSGNNIFNLGRVSNDFYLTLRAVEENGIVEVRSTPKLATLNSHAASLNIGEKRYFLEQQVVYPGTDRPIPVEANIFREVEASLKVDITPIISGDDEVTLGIAFSQSEFLAQTDVTEPPPQVSRDFNSLIRIRNGEMIVLGGLEREAESNTRTGVPFFSRIPLIGWLFGRKRKSKEKDKVMIFVKPTVIN